MSTVDTRFCVFPRVVEPIMVLYAPIPHTHSMHNTQSRHANNKHTALALHNSKRAHKAQTRTAHALDQPLLKTKVLPVRRKQLLLRLDGFDNL